MSEIADKFSSFLKETKTTDVQSRDAAKLVADAFKAEREIGLSDKHDSVRLQCLKTRLLLKYLKVDFELMNHTLQGVRNEL